MDTDLQEGKKSIIRVCRDMVSLGLTVGTWGNVSIFSRENARAVITPSGMDYAELVPEDMVTVDLEGQVTEGTRRPSIETPLHLAIYRAREDVTAVVHTHSPFATSAAVARVPLPAVVEDMAQIAGGAVEVASYAPPGSRQLADNVAAALAGRNAVLLANHGVVGVGATVDEAFRVCQVVEKTAMIYAFARLFGQPVPLSERDIEEMHRFYKTQYGQDS